MKGLNAGLTHANSGHVSVMFTQWVETFDVVFCTTAGLPHATIQNTIYRMCSWFTVHSKKGILGIAADEDAFVGVGSHT